MVVGISHPLNLAKISLKTIVIDPGHGGKDPGCISYGKDVYEKDICLSIAKKLGKLIKDSLPEVKVIYTRTTDAFIPLWQRAAVANKNNADLFISVHCNAHQNSGFHGSETYVMGLHKTAGNLAVSKRENQAVVLEEDYDKNEAYEGFNPNSEEAHIILSLYQSAYRNQSLQLAANLQSTVEKEKIRKNLGVKEAGFLVLWKTAMPSVLVESGFLTNPDDKKFLISGAGQDKMAQSILESIQTYKTQLEKK
ncbi:MAG: N-acetylmuramoyl-L-alanine amidase [Flavobacteriales bacterium]|nr:N-acetylmuramoyl-L-alanine amidase [Bacteroidota bacterium]MCB9240251.1 N-acetylmuramoyl-L-alanine amidase [Flavobacteriales bacterium]